MSNRITTEMVKELRARSGAGVMDCYSALASCAGDAAAAERLIRTRRAANPVETPGEDNHRAGVVHSYIHAGDRIGVLVEVTCGTDFAARTEEFKAFTHDLAMHIAAMKPSWISPEDASWDSGEDGEIDTMRYLLLQPFVKDASRTIGELLSDLSDRLGEPCSIRRFVRWETGEDVEPEPAPQALDKPKGPMVAVAVLILTAFAAALGLMVCLP